MRRRSIVSLLVFCLSLLVLAAGCKTGASQKPDESLTDNKRPVPGFYEEIPADTFFVYTGLEPFPEDVIREMLQSRDGSAPLAGALETLTSGNANAPEALVAIAEELEGNMSPEGLRKLGVDINGQFAIYGLGLQPVFRFELADAEAFKETLDRVESRTDTTVEHESREGSSYRLYRSKAGGMIVPIVVRDGAVIISPMDDELLEPLLPYLLGHETPEKSLAETTHIRDLAAKYDYEKFGLGYLDLAGLVRSVTGIREPNAVAAAMFDRLRETGANEPDYSEVCKEEIDTLVGNAPRAVVGLTEFSSESMQLHGGLEVESKLGSQLAGAVESIPGAGTSTFNGAAVSVGLGLNVEKVKQVLNTRAASIVDDPYECQSLDFMNRWAQRIERQMVPASISQLRGVTVMLEGLTFGKNDYIPSNVEAMALVRSGNPQGLLGQVQAFVPGLMQADIEDDGVPVSLPQLGQRAAFLKTPHIAMTDELLALSTGVGMQDEMAVMLEQSGSAASGSAMALSWNLEKIQSSLPDRVTGLLARMFGEEYAEAMTGSRTTEIQLTDGGVFLESRSKGSPASADKQESSGK